MVSVVVQMMVGIGSVHHKTTGTKNHKHACENQELRVNIFSTSVYIPFCSIRDSGISSCCLHSYLRKGKLDAWRRRSLPKRHKLTPVRMRIYTSSIMYQDLWRLNHIRFSERRPNPGLTSGINDLSIINGKFGDSES